MVLVGRQAEEGGCEGEKRDGEEKWAVLRKHEKHIDGLLSQAKAELGLFSELGLEEGRTLFWQSFQAGKVCHKPLSLCQ